LLVGKASISWHCTLQSAAVMLTIGGVECAFSLGLDQDRIPLTLQVVSIEQVTCGSSIPHVGVEVILSDGIH
jgi:hypothetical protein